MLWTRQPDLIGRVVSLMSEKDADTFLREAEECRRWAEKAVSEIDRQAWHRLEAEWLKMADAAKRRRT